MSLQPEDRMPRLESADHVPGAPIETRRLSGGAVVLIMRIAGDHQMPARAQLVLRCEPDGQIFAAIAAPSSRVA
jgi:hypothetical protein